MCLMSLNVVNNHTCISLFQSIVTYYMLCISLHVHTGPNLVHQQNENTTWQLSSHALNAHLKPPIRDQTHFLWFENSRLMEVQSFRNVFNLCHLSLYWCAQTFPLPWHTSCSLLHVQETLLMSIWFRTGKHNICSNNSAGKSVNCLAKLSEISVFVPKTRSPVYGVAIFSVYSDDLIEAPPSCQRKHAPFWCKGLNFENIVK